MSTTSTMPTSPYEHIDDVERLEFYRPGARDEQLAKYVAIKVGVADHSSKEVDILSQFSARAVENVQLGGSLIPLILDRFTLDGPNGTHPCSVTTPARCNLAEVSEPGSGPFQLHVARSLAAQLAVAVAYVHRLGYVHGDIHMGNILLQLPSLDHLSFKKLYGESDPPEPEPVIRFDGRPLSPGVPPHVYPPIWLGKPGDEVTLPEAKLVLADFGTAFCPAQESRFESYTPLQIRPPEARFEPTTPLSYASDIWSLGCVIWGILGVRPFLDNWLFGTDDATANHVDALGSMPDEWWETWEGKPKRFSENGKPRKGREVWTFDERFQDAIQEPRRRRGLEAMDDSERDALFKMIRGMLVFKPGDRLSAEEVLRSDWMRTYAIPEAEKTWGRKLFCNDLASTNRCNE
ncbi:Protein kinase domain protein [Colletotrichum higginsianum IMI 349063]|uniref:Protein kinase domain protein n=1 Tax=Colletotrichum higginsianum (strain IMI 349063) TaxID=759273 RepID=A0A1B7Y4R2_COLHI|nr:Protein kinase domain protein [Colletotrichum higginsianum IMI 349063]OBR06973.1 Protein kinase domain protein [Colletotrichum higginsianum IMI 349063]